MKKILFYTNIPSPYRVNFFNELGKFCELTVLFETAYSSERDEEWKKYNFSNFTGIVMNGRRMTTDSAFCPEITKYLKKGVYDEIIVSVLSSLTALTAAFYLKSHHIPYIYEGDGGFVHPDNKLKYLIKKYIISNAKCVFSTCKAFDEYCINYKASPDRIVRYPLSSIYEKDIIDKPLDKEEKNELRSKLSISEEKVIVSVGQMIPRKGFDILLEAAKVLDESWGIYLIGGKPTADILAAIEDKKLSNVHFVDFMNYEELSKYYRAADVFVLPTREDIWGLVVNEAMANGLPVITTTRCNAGLEMVEDGVNGRLYDPEDIEGLKEILLTHSVNEEKLSEMAQKALDKSHDFSLDRMVEVHKRELL